MCKAISAAGVLLIAAGATSVLAADLPSMRGLPVAPVLPALSWTGVYVGVQAGEQWGQTSWNRFGLSGTTFFPELAYGDNGFVGGGHVGFDYQVNQFVFGLEGDVEGTNYNGNGISTTNSFVNTTRADLEASIRGRAGIAWNSLLFYVTGGGAYERFRLVEKSLPTGLGGGNDFKRIGWTAGGGVEFAIDTHWSVRLEDRYSNFGHNTFSTSAENLRQDVSDNRVEAGISYKFDMFAPPAPVVAKY